MSHFLDNAKIANKTNNPETIGDKNSKSKLVFMYFIVYLQVISKTLPLFLVSFQNALEEHVLYF